MPRQLELAAGAIDVHADDVSVYNFCSPRNANSNVLYLAGSETGFRYVSHDRDRRLDAESVAVATVWGIQQSTNAEWMPCV